MEPRLPERCRRFALALVIAALALNGCRLQLVAAHDAGVEDDIVDLAGEVDRFWGRLLDTPADERDYDAFRDDYNEIEGDLHSLVLANEIRPLNEASTDQARTALALWQADRAHHREHDGFDDFLARRHREQFHRVFRAMALGEAVKHPDHAEDGEETP